jgi:hypothetical protein
MAKQDLAANSSKASEEVKTSSEITVAGSTIPAVSVGSSLSTEDFALFEGAPTGLENVTSKDVLIPRMTILQALSPQLNKQKPEYIKNAEVGDFCDVAMGDTFREGFNFLPVYFAVVYLEWAPRASGKGLVANHGLAIPKELEKQLSKDDKGRDVLPNGNYIVATATWFGLNLTAGGRRTFIPLSSTAFKASRNWMTKITNEKLNLGGREISAPIYWRGWTISTTHESNAQGDWFGWKMEAGPTVLEIDPTKNLLNSAKDFYAQIRSGFVQGDFTTYSDDDMTQHADGADTNRSM